MKERLPIALSSAALIVALFGVTPIGSAAGGAVVSLSRLSASRPNAKPRPRVVRGPRGPRGLRGRVGPQGPPGTPDPSSFYTKAESDSRFASQATVAALQARIGALESKLAAVSYDSTNHVLLVTGANVQIVDGSGDTGGEPNGLGNLIVGYNADNGDARDGSHNLVVGDGHTYTSFGGLVAGIDNGVTGEFASVTGGRQNTASGIGASVSGGLANTAGGSAASISGGLANTAGGSAASISGGISNTASAENASVSGGFSNTAGGYAASVSGGFSNTAGGTDSSVSGGGNNTTTTTAQWLAGTLHPNTSTIVVPGGVAGNGVYATRATEATCVGGELFWGGGAFWVNEVNDDEHPMISSRANAGLTGWSARGGNDTSVDRTLTVQVLCLGP